MITLKKFLTEAPLDLDEPAVQRALFTDISEGLEKSGEDSSLACSALQKYLTKYEKEPEFPEFPEGAPPKNLASSIRSKEISPSEESLKNYQEITKEPLPGTGEHSPSERNSEDMQLGFQASNYQRGFPLTSQEKMGVGGTVPEQPTAQQPDSGSPAVWGPSKAFAGIFSGDKQLYNQGMSESLSIGKALDTFNLQNSALSITKKGLEAMLGKDGVAALSEALQPLKSISKDFNSICQAASDPMGLSPGASLMKAGFQQLGSQQGTAMGAGVSALTSLASTLANPKTDKAIQDCISNLSDMFNPKAKKKGGKDEEAEEPDSATPKKAEKSFMETFPALLSSNVAYSKVLKAGGNPKQAGEASSLSSQIAKEETDGMTNSLKTVGAAGAKAIKDFAVNGLSKAALAVPPPAGLALSLSIQVASLLGELALNKGANKEEASAQGAEPSKGPLAGLAAAIPGHPQDAASIPLSPGASLMKKGFQTMINKKFPNGIAAGIGEKAGDSVVQASAPKQPEPNPNAALDREL